MMHEEADRSRLRAWLQLFRAPNLFTVPGDPLAGYFLAAHSTVLVGSSLGLVLAASLSFYAAGLAWNDYFDFKEDRRARANRPLPSGDIRPRTALWAGCALAGMGLLLCARVGGPTFWIGMVLAACAFTYNHCLKSVPGVGVFTMGACRALSVLLGASAVPMRHPFSPPVWIAAIVVLLYVASVSQLARRETEPHHPGIEAWMPLLALLLGAFFLVPTLADGMPARVGFATAYAAAMAVTLLFALRMRAYASTPNLPLDLARKQAILTVLPVWIGRLIGVLLLLQVAFILSAGFGRPGALAAVVVLACGTANRLLARTFYAS